VSENVQLRFSEGVRERLRLAATLRKVRPGALAEELLNEHLPTAGQIAQEISGRETSDAKA
jgi:hypothetical protein